MNHTHLGGHQVQDAVSLEELLEYQYLEVSYGFKIKSEKHKMAPKKIYLF